MDTRLEKRRLSAESERVNPVDSVHVWRSPPGAAHDILIVTPLSVYSAIHDHAVRSLPDETGGFLLGRVGFDPLHEGWHIQIEEAVAIQPLEHNPIHFSFTWKDVDRVRSYREEQGIALVGWYHTHPDMGIFLSETDMEKTQRVLFSEPFQIALVYDPVRARAGYFFWEGTQVMDTAPASWREFEIAVAEELKPEPEASQEPETCEAEKTDPGPAARTSTEDTNPEQSCPIEYVSQLSSAVRRSKRFPAMRLFLLGLLAGILLVVIVGIFLMGLPE